MQHQRVIVACRELEQFWGIHARYEHAFLNTADGLALLALLCNAAAKEEPRRFYPYKALLVEAACRHASRHNWWVDTHRYAMATGIWWADQLNIWWHDQVGGYLWAIPMPIYIIETTLPFAGDTLQLAFHFRPGDDLPNLPDPPQASGRRWRQHDAQAHAATIATAWLRTQ